MKIIIQKNIIFLTFLLALSLISCASKPINQAEKKSELENQTEIEEVLPPPPSPEEIFIDELKDISIQLISSPEEMVKGKAFEKPYQIQVLRGQEPASNFELTIEYPSSRNESQKIDVVTDEKGNYYFTPEVPEFAANTKITIAPKALNDDEAVINAVKEKSLEADWKVKSDLLKKGAILFVWDFNTKNKPTINSNELMSELRSRGSNLFGNAPMNESSEIGQDLSKLYKENYEIVNDMYGYLICGTIKFAEDMKLNEETNKYLCSLIAEISAVDMKNGEVIYSQTFTNEATGTWTESITKCKEELSKMIVDSLLYGL
ncbi:MAG: hypothetical protein K5866_01355 [Treponema sp.]|nr:hypothetical protein [Treponema sp.]